MPSVVVVAALALLAVACSRPTASPTARPPSSDMAPLAGSKQPGNLAPVVKGFYNGGEVLFIHTEASDSQVAGMLTQMMGSQVVLVPNLAQAPQSVLATVYVFTNGVKGDGPFGYQADIFDSVPGDPGYSPLRAIHLVVWEEGLKAHELRSAEEVQAAASKGELKITRSGAVANMPILEWPGGSR